MLNLKCDKCGRELSQPGALLFSPPTGEGWLVEKYHLCQDCWLATIAVVRPATQSDRGGKQRGQSPKSGPKRRWFRFSLRTLFLVVTLIACWLGWNVYRVRERERVQHDIAWRGARIFSPGFPAFPAQLSRSKPKLASQKTMPVIWTVFGAEPLGSIVLPEKEFTDDERRRIQSLFPEADVSMLTSPPGMGQGMM